MTISLGNRAKMSTSTTGTGTITLGSAVSGFQTFADAGITNGQTVRYAIDDGANFEIGSGTYTSSGTTLTRSVTESSNSDSAISLSGSAEVFIAATVADLNPLYAAETTSSTNPTASGTNSLAIGSNAAASGSTSIAIGKSSVASSLEGVALGPSSTASGVSAVGLGYYAISSSAHAISGPHSLASGTNSVSFGMGTNTSTYGANATSAVALGHHAQAVSSYSFAAGGTESRAGATYATAIGGSNGIASGSYAIVLGGLYNTASGENSVASGSRSLAAIYGKKAHASGRFSSNGDAQGGMYVLRSDTSDATAEAMTTNNSTAAATNQIVAASDTCITFHGTITAMQNGAQAYGGWEIKGMLVNDGGTTSLALGNVSDMAATNASSWAVALSADNTNNALKIQVTGEAAHNIRWVANVQTAEVTYA